MPTNSVIFLVFTGILAFAVLLQTLILLGFLIAAKAAQKKATEEISRLRGEMQPFLKTATHMAEALDEMTPRIRAIAVNVQTASERLRDQVQHVEATVGELTGKTRHQVGRIDTMVTDTLDAIAHGTRVIQDNVMAPLRHVGGWVATVRTGMDMFRFGTSRGARRSEPAGRAEGRSRGM